jgi:hypothetical protein
LPAASWLSSAATSAGVNTRFRSSHSSRAGIPGKRRCPWGERSRKAPQALSPAPPTGGPSAPQAGREHRSASLSGPLPDPRPHGISGDFARLYRIPGKESYEGARSPRIPGGTPQGLRGRHNKPDESPRGPSAARSHHIGLALPLARGNIGREFNSPSPSAPRIPGAFPPLFQISEERRTRVALTLVVLEDVDTAPPQFGPSRAALCQGLECDAPA